MRKLIRLARLPLPLPFGAVANKRSLLAIENLIDKEHKLRTDVDLYQSRLNLTPVREQELTAIQRDYDLLKLHYGELLKKEQESQLATDLEKRQEGQQFRLADLERRQGSNRNRVHASVLRDIEQFTPVAAPAWQPGGGR